MVEDGFNKGLKVRLIIFLPQIVCNVAMYNRTVHISNNAIGGTINNHVEDNHFLFFNKKNNTFSFLFLQIPTVDFILGTSVSMDVVV